MPSEKTFKQHAEMARSALNNFNAIHQLDAPGPVKTAFDELVAIIADFNNFVPFFVNHPLFLEIPLLACTASRELLVQVVHSVGNPWVTRPLPVPIPV